MKYRIIKRGDKQPHYYAQYINERTGLWETIKEPSLGLSILDQYLPARIFPTPKAARKAIKRIARRQHEASLARVIEEDTL